MKILIGSPTSTGIGGIARHVQGLTNYLKTHGHQVEIISSENTFTIPIRKLKNPSFMLSAFLKSKFKKNFDIVHAQGPPAAFALKGASGKKVLSLHGIHHQQIKLLHGNSAGNLAEKYEKFALEWADVITVSSQEMVDYYANKGYDVKLTPNAIDIKNLPQKILNKFPNQIIYAARLSEEKGILTVLEICKNLPDKINLIILGDGPERNLVEQTVANNDHVHYLGPQNKETTISLIRGSDLLIQPSLMEGGTSYTLLESMACKTPIICTDVGGGKDLLKHAENAFLITPNDPIQLHSSIVELMSNPSQREKLAETAFSSVSKLDWEIIGKQYIKIYRELLE